MFWTLQAVMHRGQNTNRAKADNVKFALMSVHMLNFIPEIGEDGLIWLGLEECGPMILKSFIDDS